MPPVAIVYPCSHLLSLLGNGLVAVASPLIVLKAGLSPLSLGAVSIATDRTPAGWPISAVTNTPHGGSGGSWPGLHPGSATPRRESLVQGDAAGQVENGVMVAVYHQGRYVDVTEAASGWAVEADGVVIGE
jgi:hypothetical protein